MTFGHDLLGRVTYPDGNYINTDRLVTGEMSHVRENGSGGGEAMLAVLGYDDLGRRVSLTRGNGAVTTYGYDAAGQLGTLSHDLNGTAWDQTYGYTYNAAGQITSRTASNDAYAYAPASGTKDETANGLNQVTQSGTAVVTYDVRGNVTSDGCKTYGYSSENRLTSATGTAALSYDPLGRLASAEGVRFAYDRAELIGEYNGSGTMTARHVHGPGVDEPLVWYNNSGMADRCWLAADERGSVVSLTSVGTALFAANRYDEYGVPAPRKFPVR